MLKIDVRKGDAKKNFVYEEPLDGLKLQKLQLISKAFDSPERLYIKMHATYFTLEYYLISKLFHEQP